MSAERKLRWVLICLGLWALMELAAALLVSTDGRTLVLL